MLHQHNTPPLWYEPSSAQYRQGTNTARRGCVWPPHACMRHSLSLYYLVNDPNTASDTRRRRRQARLFPPQPIVRYQKTQHAVSAAAVGIIPHADAIQHSKTQTSAHHRVDRRTPFNGTQGVGHSTKTTQTTQGAAKRKSAACTEHVKQITRLRHGDSVPAGPRHSHPRRKRLDSGCVT